MRHRDGQKHLRHRGAEPLTTGELAGLVVHALSAEEQARQLVTQVLFAHPGISPLHALQEGELRVEGNALRNIRPLEAIVDPVGGLHGGAVLRVLCVGNCLKEGGLATAVRTGDAQMLGAAENQVFGVFRRGSLIALAISLNG